MKIYPFSASYPNKELIPSPDSFFENISAEYVNFRNAGFFERAEKKAMYIYRISGPKIYTGILASNDISDLEDNNILGHENTLNEKEQEMLHLMLSRRSMIKPVLLAYLPSESVNNFIKEFIDSNDVFFEFSLQLQNEVHQVWKIDDEKNISLLQQYFKAEIPKSYIADGHHRAAITSKLVKKKYLHDHDDHAGLLCAFFPMDELEVYEFNRIVNIEGITSRTKFMAKLSKYMHISPIDSPEKPKEKFELTMVLNQEWYCLKWKEDVLEIYKHLEHLLDVDLFNIYVLEMNLKITDIRNATNVKYLGGVLGIEGLMEQTKKSNFAVGFCLYPLTKNEVINTADRADVLPPKSTWFEPRMKNGLLIKDF